MNTIKYFTTAKAAKAFAHDSGFSFKDMGKDATKGERWAVEYTTNTTRTPRTGTKAAQVRNIVKKMQKKERGDVLDAIISATGLTKVAASTYYYNAKRTLGL